MQVLDDFDPFSDCEFPRWEDWVWDPDADGAGGATHHLLNLPAPALLRVISFCDCRTVASVLNTCKQLHKLKGVQSLLVAMWAWEHKLRKAGSTMRKVLKRAPCTPAACAYLRSAANGDPAQLLEDGHLAYWAASCMASLSKPDYLDWLLGLSSPNKAISLRALRGSYDWCWFTATCSAARAGSLPCLTLLTAAHVPSKPASGQMAMDILSAACSASQQGSQAGVRVRGVSQDTNSVCPMLPSVPSDQVSIKATHSGTIPSPAQGAADASAVLQLALPLCRRLCSNQDTLPHDSMPDSPCIPVHVLKPALTAAGAAGNVAALHLLLAEAPSSSELLEGSRHAAEALVLASRAGHAEFVGELVSVLVSARTDTGESTLQPWGHLHPEQLLRALVEAVEAQSLGGVRALLQAGALVGKPARWGVWWALLCTNSAPFFNAVLDLLQLHSQQAIDADYFKLRNLPLGCSVELLGAVLERLTLHNDVKVRLLEIAVKTGRKDLAHLLLDNLRSSI